jgi:hypothetical protein
MAAQVTKIKCPQCGAGLRLTLPLPVGQELKCPACQAAIQFDPTAAAAAGPPIQVDAPADRRIVALVVAMGVMSIAIAAMAAILLTRSDAPDVAEAPPTVSNAEQNPPANAPPGTTSSDRSGAPNTTQTGATNTGTSLPPGESSVPPASGPDNTFLPPEEPMDPGAIDGPPDGAGLPVSTDTKIDPPNVDDPPDAKPVVNRPPINPAGSSPVIGPAPKANIIPGLPPGPIYRFLPYLGPQGLVPMPGGMSLSAAQPALLLDVNSLVVPESGQQLGTKPATFVVGLWRSPTAPVVLQLVSSSPFVTVTPSRVTLTAGAKSARIQVQGANPDTTPSPAGSSSLTKATITISVMQTLDAAYFTARPRRTLDVWMVDDDRQGLAWNTLPGDLDTAGKLKTQPGTGTNGTRLFVQLRAPLKTGTAGYVVAKIDTQARAKIIPFDAPGSTTTSGAVVLKFDKTNPWNRRQELKIQGTTQTGDFNVILEPLQVVKGKVQTTLIGGKQVAPLATAPASLDTEFFKVRPGTQPATNAKP